MSDIDVVRRVFNGDRAPCPCGGTFRDWPSDDPRVWQVRCHDCGEERREPSPRDHEGERLTLIDRNFAPPRCGHDRFRLVGDVPNEWVPDRHPRDRERYDCLWCGRSTHPEG